MTVRAVAAFVLWVTVYGGSWPPRVPVKTLVTVACMTLLAIALAFVGTTMAHAHLHGATAELNACLATLHSKAGSWCCDGNDAEEATWDTDENGYVVHVKNPQTGEMQKFKVPDGALVIGDKCHVGAALVWWHPVYFGGSQMAPEIRCFQPGAGG